jgi:Outer membrane protein beta-barrel domain
MSPNSTKGLLMKRYLVLAALSILATTGSVFAQGLNIRSAELSLSAGYTNFTSKKFTIGQPQSSTPINGSMSLSNGTMYEARINFYTNKRLGAEFLYGYQYGGVNFKTDTTNSSFGVPLQVHTIGLNLDYYFVSDPNARWRPFVTLGGGAVIYRPSTGGQRSAKDPLEGNFDTFFETSRGFGSVGGGVKHPLTKSIGLRADAGVMLSKVPTFGLPESSAITSATVLPVGGLVRSVRASGGVVFYLGK